MVMARELNYTLADFTASETFYNMGLWNALMNIEAKDRKREELARDAMQNLDLNNGRFTRGIRI